MKAIIQFNNHRSYQWLILFKDPDKPVKESSIVLVSSADRNLPHKLERRESAHVNIEYLFLSQYKPADIITKYDLLIDYNTLKEVNKFVPDSSLLQHHPGDANCVLIVRTRLILCFTGEKADQIRRDTFYMLRHRIKLKQLKPEKEFIEFYDLDEDHIGNFKTFVEHDIGMFAGKDGVLNYLKLSSDVCGSIFWGDLDRNMEISKNCMAPRICCVRAGNKGPGNIMCRGYNIPRFHMHGLRDHIMEINDMGRKTTFVASTNNRDSPAIVHIMALNHAVKALSKKHSRDFHEGDLDQYMWEQSWCDPGCGFKKKRDLKSEVQITKATTSVFTWKDTAMVYHDGSLAHIVNNPNEEFWEACRNWNLPGKIGGEVWNTFSSDFKSR